ncbi:hypothetical protein LCGC14_2504700, partial [marine sediment metagenome]
RKRDGSKKRPSHVTDNPVYEHSTPDCPAHVTGEARAEWDRLCARLHTAGTLTQEARSTMTGYCLLWSQHIAAKTLIDEHGQLMFDNHGKAYKNPAVNIYLDCLRLMNSYASELGLSPVARGRVQAIKPKTKDPKDKYFKVGG